ncbi:MAG TPA: hypothetical protein VMG12_11465 [Polyangiaceae bacterium]|nr:hypothetical protein [Polyangiaceae bacterium]
MIARASRELFGFDEPETRGERWHFQLYETFLVSYMVLWAWDWSRSIERTAGVVKPLGIATHLDISPMFGSGLSLVNAAVISVGALLGYFRLAPRLGYTAAFVGFHLQYVSRYSLGEICHASNFVGMGMLGLAAAMWVFQGASERRKFAMGASFFFLGLAYASAALSKLIASGPLWVDGRHLWLWIGEKSLDAYSKYGVLELNPLQRAALGSRALATLILAVGLVVEAAGVLLWFRKPRAYVALLCIGMHLGIHFAMNILFDMSIYHLIVLGLPWAALFDRVLRRRAARVSDPAERSTAIVGGAH